MSPPFALQSGNRRIGSVRPVADDKSGASHGVDDQREGHSLHTKNGSQHHAEMYNEGLPLQAGAEEGTRAREGKEEHVQAEGRGGEKKSR